MVETFHLDFHCGCPRTHQSFLKAHSGDILHLTEEQAIQIRVFTPDETIKQEQQQQHQYDNDAPSRPLTLNISKVQTHLQTRWLARVLIHTPAIASTQDVFKSKLANWSGKHGWLTLASEQTSGRGRHGNTWLSPKGSVAFTFTLSLGMHQTLHMVFLQYLAALTIVQVAQDQPWCKRTLRIKWPNDVFADGEKVAGVLCEANMSTAKTFDMAIGIGVNVCNPNPTTCLLSSDGYEQQQKQQHEGTYIREQFIAGFLNEFEKLYDEMCTKGFQHRLQDRYLQAWMHGDQRVRMGNADGPEAVVKGLAPNGWIRVFRLDWRAFQDLPPEQTSLDIHHNVVKSKC